MVMKEVIALSAALASATAFVPSAPLSGAVRATSSRTAAATSPMRMANAEDMVGVSAPMGFFDPLGFAKKGSDEALNKYRECELKHGRIAMLAVLGWLTQEVYHPAYGGAVSGNPLKAIWDTPVEGWVQIIGFIGLVEFVSLKVRSAPGYVVGDYLGANELMDGEGDEAWKNYQLKELNNGRLAMFAIMGLIAQDMVTGQGAFEQIAAGNGGYLF